MKRAWLVAAAPLLVVACTNRNGEDRTADRVPLPEDLPQCSELFQEGQPVDTDKFGRACRSESDDLTVPRYADVTCTDGNRLLWNEFAWGYDKEPMHLFDPNSSVRVPTEEVVRCQSGDGTPSSTEQPPS